MMTSIKIELHILKIRTLWPSYITDNSSYILCISIASIFSQLQSPALAITNEYMTD